MYESVRVLIVEDSDQAAAFLERQCLSVVDKQRLLAERATNLVEAIELIEASHFDLVVCDLSIPADKITRAPDVEHGIEVVSRLRRDRAGTPLIVVSEFADDPGIQRRVFRGGAQADPYGVGRDFMMLDCLPKGDLPEAGRSAGESLLRTRDVADVPIVGPDASDLTLAEARILQVFARRIGGHRVAVEGLTGGHSGAKTLRVSVDDAAGNPRGLVAAKLGELNRVTRERNAYRSVASTLPQSLTVALADVVEAGGGGRGGVFYGFLGDHDRDLFDVLGRVPTDGEAAVSHLRAGLQKQALGGQKVRRTLLDLRRDIVGGADASSAGSLQDRVRALDELEFDTLEVLQHGDLHGKNVLLDGSSTPVLIDYADIRRTSGVLDPLTLELSPVFHPGGQTIRESWPSVEQAALWDDLDEFVSGCPFEAYVRACRDWTEDVTASPSERDAVVLCYVLRQLGFEKSPTDVGIALLEQALTRLEAGP